MFENYKKLSRQDKMTLFGILLGLVIGIALSVGLVLYATGARL